jgi:DNA-binding NarL/FixJ family response regulator
MPLKMSSEERLFKITQNAEPALRALIVDRDSMSSHLLADALVRNRKYDASAIAAADLPQALAGGKFDLVVIGADLPSGVGSGFELADSVCRSYPDVVIVLLLNETTHESVVNAFRSGARGIFSRQQSIVDFLDCIEHVKKGFIWAGREETDALLKAFKNIPAPSVMTSGTTPPLTKREFEVVQCAAQGKTNKIIASELGLSEHTVKNYLFRAFDKLGVSSRVELLFYLTIRGHVFGGGSPTPLATGFELDPPLDPSERES